MDPSIFRSLSFLLEKAGSELEVVFFSSNPHQSMRRKERFSQLGGVLDLQMLASKLEEDLNKTYIVDGSSTSPMDVLKSVRKLQSRTSRVAEQAKTTGNSKQVKRAATVSLSLSLPLCRPSLNICALLHIFSVWRLTELAQGDRVEEDANSNSSKLSGNTDWPSPIMNRFHWNEDLAPKSPNKQQQ